MNIAIAPVKAHIDRTKFAPSENDDRKYEKVQQINLQGAIDQALSKFRNGSRAVLGKITRLINVVSPVLTSRKTRMTFQGASLTLNMRLSSLVDGGKYI